MLRDVPLNSTTEHGTRTTPPILPIHYNNSPVFIKTLRMTDILYEHRRQPLLIVISGPSGAGKDTVMQRMKERGLPFHFVVTATTREKRANEEHGKDYLFVSKEEFARMINQDELIEHAIVYGDYKGIPKQQVREALASGKDVIMRIDVQGAETVRRLAPGALMIFITTESEEELVNRLETRKTETADSLALRIATARKELKRVEAFDYVVVNHEFQLDETVDIIRAIIDAEHHRVKPRKVSL
jgi:guanylate kinase